VERLGRAREILRARDGEEDLDLTERHGVLPIESI